jgi:hypothetical protein
MATVEQLITDARTDIDNTLLEADAYLNKLTSLADTTLQFDSPGEINYTTVPEVSIPQFSTGLRPSVDIGEVAAPPAVPDFNIPTIQDVSLPVDDLLAPTNDFSYFEAAYESTLLDPLKAKLLTDLVNGGYGIDTADEQALLQRVRDRETALALARIDETGRTMAARGFPLPPGELSIAIDRAQQELQSKVSSASREIFIDGTKRFVENRQFTIREVRALEQILIGFHNSVQERALNVAKATAEFSILVFNALVARYRTRVDAAKITADVEIARVQAHSLRAQALLEAYRGQIAAYEANLRRLVESARLRVELYRADIAGDDNIRHALQAKAALQQEVVRATTQQNIQITQLSIEQARSRLLADVETLKNRVAAAQFGADKFFALITSMVNTINTLGVQTAEDA